MEVTFAKDAKDGWTTQYFFFLEEPRLYGRLRVQVTGYHRSGRANLPLTYWINPSGSQNLEDAPGKFIRPVPERYLQPGTPSIEELN